MHFNPISLISKFCILHKVCMIDLKNIFANTKLMNVVLTAFCIMVDKLESGYLELSIIEFSKNFYQQITIRKVVAETRKS